MGIPLVQGSANFLCKEMEDKTGRLLGHMISGMTTQLSSLVRK